MFIDILGFGLMGRVEESSLRFEKGDGLFEECLICGFEFYDV